LNAMPLSSLLPSIRHSRLLAQPRAVYLAVGALAAAFGLSLAATAVMGALLTAVPAPDAGVVFGFCLSLSALALLPFALGVTPRVFGAMPDPRLTVVVALPLVCLAAAAVCLAATLVWSSARSRELSWSARKLGLPSCRRP
jgi:hypothetical protein